jgi:hypothetical protein
MNYFSSSMEAAPPCYLWRHVTPERLEQIMAQLKRSPLAGADGNNFGFFANAQAR